MKNALAKDVPTSIPFELHSGIPFYKQIYEGYRTAIVSGRLRPGQRLPSTRVLAVDLGISRLPAVNAFEQLLHEGYVEGKIGAGTYVKDTIPDEFTRPVLTQPVQLEKPPEPVDIFKEIVGPFRVSLPALDQFPHKIWSRLVSRNTKNLSAELMTYGDPAGYLPLREAIAQYLTASRAVRCNANQILIVSGSQMALQICARALLKSGDAVCMEEPGYPGARDALKSTGATLLPVSLDGEGIDIKQIERKGHRARVVYVTPSHQYPLGISMTASRRLELLDWARRNKSWIIEDDYDSEYRYTSRPVGSLHGMDTSSRVIYIGTFSKVLFPALRLGYVVVPHGSFSTFRSLREAFDIFSPTLYQLVLTDFLQEGHFSRHLRRMRLTYLDRRNALLKALSDHIGEFLTPYNTDAGLHLSAFLPRGFDDREVVRKAMQHGISATALSTCYAGRQSRSGLILGFGGANPRRIRVAAQTLGKVIRDLANKPQKAQY
jgi:GntR family transcriptional regulator/MocR family aminotransferase